MEHWKLSQWCLHAVQKIKYPPDRDVVCLELRQHIDDRCESFLAQGMSAEDAVEKTLEVMGDPKAIAADLASIHRPFWGYAYSITKWLCRLAAAGLVLLLFAQGLRMITEDNYSAPDYSDARFDPYSATSPYGNQRILYGEPGTTFTDSGYAVSLSRVSCWDGPGGTLYFQLKVTSLLPWADDPDFCYYITARDSLGNTYPFRDARDAAEDPDRIVNGTVYRTSVITWIYDAWLLVFDPEGVEWVELCCERDGRNMVFRIDLTGGDAQWRKSESPSPDPRK